MGKPNRVYYPHGFRQHMENRQREIAAEYGGQIVMVHAIHNQRNADLADATKARRNVFSFKRCLRAVSEVYAVSPDVILSNKRKAAIVRARQHLYWVLYNERSDLSLPAIGRLVNRDHSTVLFGIKKFEEHPDLDAIVKELNTTVWRLHAEDTQVQENQDAGPDGPRHSPTGGSGIFRDQPTTYCSS
jgi:hypothetical protein